MIPPDSRLRALQAFGRPLEQPPLVALGPEHESRSAGYSFPHRLSVLEGFASPALAERLLRCVALDPTELAAHNLSLTGERNKEDG
jgi:hypothetical protein